MIRRSSFIPATTASSVDWLGQIARLDRRRLSRIGRLDAHKPAALRPQLTDRCDEAGKRLQVGTACVGAKYDEMYLHVGRRNQRTCAKEPAGIAGADGEQPLSEQSVTQPGAGSMPPAVDHVVHGDPLRAAVLHADLKVILQVGPDPRLVGDHVYAERPQERWRSKSGQLKELRRVERATGKDHLCIRMGSASRLALPVLDTDRTAS